MRRLRIALTIILSLTVVASIAFVVWALNPHRPEPVAYSSATSDPRVIIERREGFLTIRPASSHAKIGLLFYPGLRVMPEAYLFKLVEISNAANIQIAIGEPRLNIAAFSIQQADEMRSALPGVDRWYVGGHSLGGAMACLYAKRRHEGLEGVVLLGTSCGSDISQLRLRVLSVTGENDGIFPPSKISSARSELPKNAYMVQVPGMNHAQFGNYGPQAGDNKASVEDMRARNALRDAAARFFLDVSGAKSPND